MASFDGHLRVVGGKELARTLNKLREKVSKKLLKQAVRAASKPIIKKARALVPRETGLLRQSLGVKVKKYKGDGSAVAIIGARKNFGVKGVRRPVKYAHLVEGGTDPHFMPKAVIGGVVLTALEHPGARPKRFLEPAFDQHKKQALGIMTKKLHDGIAKEVKKLRKL